MGRGRKEELFNEYGVSVLQDKKTPHECAFNSDVISTFNVGNAQSVHQSGLYIGVQLMLV